MSELVIIRKPVPYTEADLEWARAFLRFEREWLAKQRKGSA